MTATIDNQAVAQRWRQQWGYGGRGGVVVSKNALGL